MGTVHGVYLKYVGLSALSYCGYSWLNTSSGSSATSSLSSSSSSNSLLTMGGGGSSGSDRSGSVDGAYYASSTSSTMLSLVPSLILGYSTLINGAIAILFKTEKGMSLIGKNRSTGTIPMWSYIVFFPFHIPTILYTKIHTQLFTMKTPLLAVTESNSNNNNKTAASNIATRSTSTSTDETTSSSADSTIQYVKIPVPVATEVQKGWWVGGCYGHKLNKDWAGVIDLTVEFPEKCRDRTLEYLSLPTWDGVPCTPEQLEYAANFAIKAKQQKELQYESEGVVGDILVHCAHGRGRSTTVMCACLVKAGLYSNWEDAFEYGIKPYRPVCKLNRRMRQNLQAWQELYVDGNKENKKEQ